MDVREKLSNEKRLIDANEYCMELYNEMNYPGRSEEFMTAIDVAIADLADAPTVDAVEVVRCWECEHHYWEQEPCHGKIVHYCKLPHMRGVEVFKEFFCYYGERKEGADNG